MNSTTIKASYGRYSVPVNILIRLVWISVALLSIIYSLKATQFHLSILSQPISNWIYGYINFGSFVLGLIAASIIFWRKPKDWLAIAVSLMLIMWNSTGDGTELFSPPGVEIGFSQQQTNYFLTLAYELLLSLLLLVVLLTFPDGKWVPGWTRWLFILSLVGAFVMPLYVFGMIKLSGQVDISDRTWEILTDKIPQITRLGVLILGALMQLYRLWTTRNAFQRQQLKWIAVSLFGMTLFYTLFNIARIWNLWELESVQLLTIFMCLCFFSYGFIFTLAISVLRYRIWDMDLVINKAFVYGPLTAILGALGIIGSLLLEQLAKPLLDISPSLGAIVLLPIVMLFMPLRDILQNVVDKHFKPEEIDFSGAIVEFSPDAQLMLSSKDILKILVHQLKEQLSVSEAAIFLKHENGNLILSEPPQDEAVDGAQVIPPRGLPMLEKGEIVVPSDTSQYSLFIPLALKRASKPEFLGVIALGRREGGVGYSSSVIKSLQKFGVDAGRVLYVAKLRESTGKNIIERLASIEKGLANLKTDGDPGEYAADMADT